MTSYTIEEIKKIPPETLLKLIDRMKKFLKSNSVVKKMFKDHDISIDEIDIIPMRFDDLDVSARTDHGIISFNYKLLCDGDFIKDYMYAVHEMEHYLQQTGGDKPTQGADDGEYLDNPYEQDGFQVQVEYLDDMYGKDEAEGYVDHLLDHHDIDDKNEREDKKDLLMETTAQYTSLDTALRNKNPYGHNYYNTNKQQILPFNYETKNDIESSHKEQTEEQEQAAQQVSFVYPELKPEQIKSRRLSPEDIARLQRADEAESEHRSKYWYGKPEERDIPSNKKIYDIDETFSPEEAKEKVLAKYKQFRELTAIFYEKYKEANAFAEDQSELDLNAPYLQIIKDFPKFLVAAVKRQIGSLFGVVPEGRRQYNYDHRAKNLAAFINTGLNIFNITPENFEQKIFEMKSAMKEMTRIIEAYEKRKKLLIKLPTLVEEASKEFISNKAYRDFLKWMDEYFPNDKKEVIRDSIANIEDNYSYGSENKFFRIGDLKKIKTYKGIYDKAMTAATTGLYGGLKHHTMKELELRLKEEIKDRIRAKVVTLNGVVERSSYDNIKELNKYVYKTFKLDLGSIISFTNSILDKFWEDAGKEVKQEDVGLKVEVPKNYASTKKAEFISMFIDNLKKQLEDFNNSYKLDSLAKDQAIAFIRKYEKEGILQTKDFSKLTEKDLDNIIVDVMKEIIVESLPNYNTSYKKNPEFPNFKSLGEIIKETGKFSIDGIMTYILKAAPFIPRDFVLNLVRVLFKGISASPVDKMMKSFVEIKDLSSTYSVFAMRILLDILNKSGKMNPNSFTTAFIEHFDALKTAITKLETELESKGNNTQTRKVFLFAIRGFGTMEQDIKNLIQFLDFAHNEASDLSKRDLMIIFSNKNFISFSKVGIVKKLVKAYAEIRDNGGIGGIRKEYNKSIIKLIKNDYISKNFYQNVKTILDFFASKELINPSSEQFNKLFEVASAFETDMEIIETSDTFIELLKDYENKDERLFRLNVQINNKLRFSVLKDKDPRTLRVGIETDCCQRIGGAGESSAKDSFVNPLAGVVILEWRNGENWELLSQSYFHYVPEDNSFILDNVEKNRENVKESGVNLETAYAYLAKYVKDKFDVKYFLSGKGYSDINVNEFERREIEGGEDPRSFSPKALGAYRSRVYSDFNPNDSMDLLNPKFELAEKINALPGQKQEETKKAFEINLRKIILGTNFKIQSKDNICLTI